MPFPAIWEAFLSKLSQYAPSQLMVALRLDSVGAYFGPPINTVLDTPLLTSLRFRVVKKLREVPSEGRGIFSLNLVKCKYHFLKPLKQRYIWIIFNFPPPTLRKKNRVRRQFWTPFWTSPAETGGIFFLVTLDTITYSNPLKTDSLQFFRRKS